jgi:hypothetical protein
LGSGKFKRRFVGENGVKEKVFRADQLRPLRQAANAIGPPGELLIENLAGIVPKPVRYLVPDRIPAGMLGMFTGEGGHGKSVTTLNLAASITTGRCAFGLSYPDAVKGKALIIS